MENKTKKAYLEYLNNLFTYEDIYYNFGELLKNNWSVDKALSGQYGTLLKKHEPIKFNKWYLEWKLLNL